MAGPFVVGRHAVAIAAPPGKVFGFLADLARHGEWNGEPDFAVTARPDGQPGVGALCRREKSGVMRGPLIIRGGMSDNPVRIVKTVIITDYLPYCTLAFETRNSYNGLLVSIDRMSFEIQQDAGGSRVTLVLAVEAMVPSGFIGPVYAIRVLRAFLERLTGRRSENLKPGPFLPRIKAAVETGESQMQP